MHTNHYVIFAYNLCTIELYTNVCMTKLLLFLVCTYCRLYYTMFAILLYPTILLYYTTIP